MTVAAVLKSKGAEVVSVLPATTVAQAAEVIARRRIGAVVVLDGGGALRGILSERDVVRGLVAHGPAMMEMPVEALMTRDVVVASPAMSVEEAMEVMDEGYFRHLPVMGAEGRLVGIVSIRDLVRHRITLQQGDVESLQAYVLGRGYALGRLG